MKSVQKFTTNPRSACKLPPRVLKSIDDKKTNMVWMPLMNKTNMRRRKSQSPSSSDSSPRAKNGVFFGSKNKRRILRKRDSAITEASSLSSRWSLQTDGALWRVGEFFAFGLAFFNRLQFHVIIID